MSTFHHNCGKNFAELKATSSIVLFCLTESLKLKNISIMIIYDEEKQQILTFKKLETLNIWRLKLISCHCWLILRWSTAWLVDYLNSFSLRGKKCFYKLDLKNLKLASKAQPSWKAAQDAHFLSFCERSNFTDLRVIIQNWQGARVNPFIPLLCHNNKLSLRFPVRHVSASPRL